MIKVESIDNKAMLDIFDDLSQRNNLEEKDNFSIIEENEPGKHGFNPENLIVPEEVHRDGRMGHGGNPAQGLLSRKGSGDQTQILNTSISFMYQTDPLETAPEAISQYDIGAALSPNLDHAKILGRRATRASESDELVRESGAQARVWSEESCFTPEMNTREHTLNPKNKRQTRGGQFRGGKALVTEQNYTEKFNYRKFINQELSKLGNICG